MYIYTLQVESIAPDGNPDGNIWAFFLILFIYYLNLGMHLHCLCASRLKNNCYIAEIACWGESVHRETCYSQKQTIGICVQGNYWNYLHAHVDMQGSAPTLNDC